MLSAFGGHSSARIVQAQFALDESERRNMKGRIKLNKRTSERKFTNSALRTKKLNISAKPRRGGIRM